MLSRLEFKKYWEDKVPGFSTDDSPLFAYEAMIGKKSRWFVRTKFIETTQDEFWKWCSQNCSGQILCYSSNEDEEWWGFSHQADIVMWLLRWS